MGFLQNMKKICLQNKFSEKLLLKTSSIENLFCLFSAENQVCPLPTPKKKNQKKKKTKPPKNQKQFSMELRKS